MEILTSDEIESALFDRLKKTQELYNQTISESADKEDNLDLVQIIYFKFFFDFSTAIEQTITSIMALKYRDAFAQKKMKILDKSTSNYLNVDEIRILFDSDKIEVTIRNIKDYYSNIIKIIPESFYRRIGLDKKISDYEDFTSYYRTSRDTRNKLAHGLINENVRYDTTTLFKFMLSFFVLHSYHKTL